MQSETANRQRHVNFPLVAIPYSFRQSFSITGNAKQSFDSIVDPDADPAHYQNLMTSPSLLSVKISAKCPCNFLCNPDNKHLALSSKAKESENLVLDQDGDWDHHQNLTT